MTITETEKQGYTQVKLTMPNEEAKELDVYCKAKGYKKAEFVRQAIKEKIDRDPLDVLINNIERMEEGELLSIKVKIEILCSKSGISVAELARRLETSQQNLYQRMQKGKFTQEELMKIAEVVGAKYFSGFVLPDGSEIR